MENRIKQFWHCAKCIDELPEGKSPREYIRVEVGFTRAGLQVWCIRHEENIIHLDFMGQKVKYYEEVTHTHITEEPTNV
jgi:hypothetical protein